MGIYEELQARGLIAQVTDEAVVRELVNNGKATFYIGFDATATVKRSDFGVGAYAPMVSDEVALKITTEATADAKK